MTLIQLEQMHGLDKLNGWYNRQIGNTPTYKKYLCVGRNGQLTGVSNSGTIHVEKLRKLLEVKGVR